jgi:tetratricopeptide (TPR) repeat protein
MNQNRLDDAIKDFTKALSIESNYSPAASNLSAVYFKKKEYEKALDYANKAVTMDKNNADAYANRGMAKEMTRDMEGACEDWHKAQELGSETGKNYYSGNCAN